MAKLNKISLNIKKKLIILFSVIKAKIVNNVNYLALKIDNEIIEQVNSCKFLGVTINSSLTWQDHIDRNSLKKISKSIGLILRIRKTSLKMY